MMSIEDTDDEIRLPADTLQILQEFLHEQKTKDLEEDWVCLIFYLLLLNLETTVSFFLF